MKNDGLKIKMNFLPERKQEFLELAEKIKNVKVNSTEYFKIFNEMLELQVEIKGHAWCMDVKSERKKMVKLVYGLLYDLN